MGYYAMRFAPCAMRLFLKIGVSIISHFLYNPAEFAADLGLAR